jgi:hypothetical protein
MADYGPITIARFWSKVDVKWSEKECWEWKGATGKFGYGRFKVGRDTCTASRVAWELANSASLGDRYALHQCDNPKCCNPNHIFPGTHQQNMDDKVAKGRGNQFSAAGSDNPRAKLTAIQVQEIRDRIKRGESNVSIAKSYPVNHHTISGIRRGVSWRSVGRDGFEPPTSSV